MCVLSVKAQNLDITYKESCTVILPTVDNLKQLCKLNEEEFTAIMTKNNYYKDADFSTHREIAFSNGNIDPFLLKCFSAICYNFLNSSIRFLIPVDMLYPENSIANLVKEVKPFYDFTTSDGYDIFKREDYFIAIKSDDKFYQILVKSY